MPLNHMDDYLIKSLPVQNTQQFGFILLFRLVVLDLGFSSGLVKEGRMYVVDCAVNYIH